MSPTLAAPTLEEMPPQHGTILELHSIGEGWDGMLVEYEKNAEVTGKLFVWPLKGKDGDGNDTEAFRVKAKCCRRPDLKPHKLRQTLSNLADTLVDEILEIDAFDPIAEERLKSILEKDPCQFHANVGLAMSEKARAKSILNTNNGSIEGECMERIARELRYLRRAYENAYAYRGFFSEDQFEFCADLLIVSLECNGRSREAAQLSSRIGEEESHPRHLMNEGHLRFQKARRLLLRERYAECFKHFMAAAWYYMQSLEALDESPGESGYIAEFCIAKIGQMLCEYHRRMGMVVQL